MSAHGRSSSSRSSASITRSSRPAFNSRASPTPPATRSRPRPTSRRQMDKRGSRFSCSATASPEAATAERPHRRRSGCAKSTTRPLPAKEVTDEDPSLGCSGCSDGRPDDSRERVRVLDVVRVHAAVEQRVPADDGLAVRARLLRHTDLAGGIRRFDRRLLGRTRLVAHRLLRPERPLEQLQRDDQGTRLLSPRQDMLERDLANAALHPLGGNRRSGAVLPDRRRRSLLLGRTIRLLLERLHQGLTCRQPERPPARARRLARQKRRLPPRLLHDQQLAVRARLSRGEVPSPGKAKRRREAVVSLLVEACHPGRPDGTDSVSPSPPTSPILLLRPPSRWAPRAEPSPFPA